MHWTVPAGHHAITIYTLAPSLAEEIRTRVIVTPADFYRRVRQYHHSFGGIAAVERLQRANPDHWQSAEDQGMDYQGRVEQEISCTVPLSGISLFAYQHE